eukprot:scaffold227923_cov17-Tisochrysis_lutea.AAC.1
MPVSRGTAICSVPPSICCASIHSLCSRNARLTPEARQAALCIPRALEVRKLTRLFHCSEFACDQGGGWHVVARQCVGTNLLLFFAHCFKPNLSPMCPCVILQWAKSAYMGKPAPAPADLASRIGVMIKDAGGLVDYVEVRGPVMPAVWWEMTMQVLVMMVQ